MPNATLIAEKRTADEITERAWYVRHFDKFTWGPYTLAEMRTAREMGRFASDTQVKHDRDTDGRWVPASEFGTMIAKPNQAPVIRVDSPALPTPPPVPPAAHVSIAKRIAAWVTLPHPVRRVQLLFLLAWLLFLPLAAVNGLPWAHRAVSAVPGSSPPAFLVHGEPISDAALTVREVLFCAGSALLWTCVAILPILLIQLAMFAGDAFADSKFFRDFFPPLT